MTDRPLDDEPAPDDLDALVRAYDRGLAAMETAASADLERQIEMRQELAARLELGRRLLLIHDEVKFLSETRRPLVEAAGCVVLGHEHHRADRATVVRLEINRHPYVLTLREPPPSHETVQAHLDLATGEGPPVFSLCVEFDASEPGSGWMPHRVDAFVPGPWVRDVLELSIRLRAPSRPADSVGEEVDPRALKQRFGLP